MSLYIYLTRFKQLDQASHNLTFGVNNCSSLSIVLTLYVALFNSPYSDAQKIIKSEKFLCIQKRSKFYAHVNETPVKLKFMT